MTEEKQNLYEGMFIISASLSEPARQTAFERVKKEITDNGGEIVKVHDLGRKRMAYIINGHRDGYYTVAYFKVKPSAMAEIWHQYHLNEDLIRFLTLRADKVVDAIEFKPLEVS